MFNLQLTIQKLEEKLSLYRNGTTAEEMFDLIKEKEAELDIIKLKLANKEETLKRLAKSSAEVLNKYDGLLADKLQIENDFNTHTITSAENEQRINKLLLEKTLALQLIQDKEEEMVSKIIELNEVNAYAIRSVADKDEQIACLKATIINHEIEAANHKQEQDKLGHMAMELNRKENTIQHLKDSLADSDRSIEKLQKRCADLLSEKAEKVRQLDAERQDMMGHVTKFKEMMGSNMAQRDEALKRRDDKIKEVCTISHIHHVLIRISKGKCMLCRDRTMLMIACTASY